MLFMQNNRRKLKGSDAELTEQLRRMYWDERGTTLSIGRALGVNPRVVYWTMRHLGIEIRRKGAKPVPLKCRIKGCDEPPKRIWHVKAKAWYGTLCKEHLRQYKNAKSRYMKSSAYPGISEEERWLRIAKERLIETRKLCRAQ